MSPSVPDLQPIRDAACVILADTSGSEPKLLLGKRRETQIFLPNKWVFPGGRLDQDDHVLASELLLPGLIPGEVSRLPFIVAAMRELYEEAGILLGSNTAAGTIAGRLDAGRIRHAMRYLTPLARAITPPGRPRRFDTWFFVAPRGAACTVKEPDGELLDLDWFSLSEARALDLPNITRYVVDDVAAYLKRGGAAINGSYPFYFQGPERYERQLVTDLETQ